MTLTLYTAYLNSAGHRVRIALALKKIEYDYVSVFQIGKPAYRQFNPQGLMPALKIGDRIVPQATAILEYLEETYPDPPLLPADPARRSVRPEAPSGSPRCARPRPAGDHRGAG